MLNESESLKILQQRVKNVPKTLMILGSGWSKVIDQLDIETEIDFETLFGVKATVPGHAGKLVVARHKKERVAIMAGRFHTYEGFTARQATLPIRVFAEAGVTDLILTAACGGLNEKYKVGDFVILSDMLTLFLALDNPLLGPQFLDVSEVFDPTWRAQARSLAVELKIPFHEGIYCYYHGPNYETPADKMALRLLGADVVGMSTVPEALVARWHKMRVMGLAFVTNLAFVKHDHKEVVAQAEKASQQMSDMLLGLLESQATKKV
jgi:purine-nucleoside phosphorylase